MFIEYRVMNETGERIVTRHSTETEARNWIKKMQNIFKEKTPIYRVFRATTTTQEV